MVFERERREKIPQRLCYINAAKICNSGQGSAFDRGRRGKKLIDFCLKFQSSSLRIACYADVYLNSVSFPLKVFGHQILLKAYKIKSVYTTFFTCAFCAYYCFVNFCLVTEKNNCKVSA
jgi:hypothetical protein